MKIIKKILIEVTIFLLFSTTLIYGTESESVTKQTYAHQINIGYGAPNSFFISMVNEFAPPYINYENRDDTSMLVDRNQLKGPGVFQIGYDWFPIDWLSVGIDCSYEPFKIIHLDKNNNEKSDNPSFFWTVQGEVGFHYGWDLIQLYHGLAAGFGFCHSKENACQGFFAFNVIPIGIEVGKGHGVYGFANLGIGTSAYINAGIGYRFPK